MTAYGQRQYPDSLDYIVLNTLTKPDAWIGKFKGYPNRLDEETFNYIKERFPEVDVKYSELSSLRSQNEIWDKERIGRRTLKSNSIRIPLIGSPPRRKSVSYISSPIYLNKEKTLAIVSWSEWGDIGWHESSGFGELRIFKFQNGRWILLDEPIGGFTT